MSDSHSEFLSFEFLWLEGIDEQFRIARPTSGRFTVGHSRIAVMDLKFMKPRPRAHDSQKGCV